MKRFWLMKTEPDTFGIEDLKRVGEEPWSGVRNFTARNYMKDMAEGDVILFYHSSCPIPGVYGLAQVSQTAEPDETQFDKKSEYYDPRATIEKPLWYCVHVSYDRTFEHPVTLAAMRKDPKLASMITLQPGSRLSVTPVTKAEYEHILFLAKQTEKPMTLPGIEPGLTA